MSNVSVIVPTFNSEGLIVETLKAIFSQTNPPAEVIVIDDQSTDDTASRVAAFPVRYYKTPQNGGVGRARNFGVSHAASEWIAFCDHDDIWRRNYLERFMAHMKPDSFYGFSNWVDLLGDVWTNIEKFAAAPPGFFDDLQTPLYRKLIQFVPVWPSATLIRKDFFDKIGGFDQQFSRFATEDFEFTLRCNEYAPAVIVKEPLVGIRKHQGNYSAGKVRQQLSDAAILEYARDNHRSGRLFKTEIDRSVIERRLGALGDAFAYGDLQTVRAIAELLPPDAMDARARLKIAMARSRVVPGALVRTLFGPREGRPRAGRYTAHPATLR